METEGKELLSEKEQNADDKTKSKEQSYWRFCYPWKFGTKKNRNELSEYGFLQIIFLVWVAPLVWKGTNKIMENEDLGDCPPSLQSCYTLPILKYYVTQENRRVTNSNKMSFFRIYMLFWRKQFFITMLFMFVNGAAEFGLTGIAIRKLLEYLESDDNSMKQGLLLVFYMALVMIVRSTAKNFVFFLGCRTGFYSKSAFQSLIYEKILKLNNSNKLSAGELVNLCSNDCQRLFDCCLFLPFLIFFPFNLLITTIYLYYYFGPASLFGSAIIVFYIPLQIFLGKIFTKLRSMVIAITDKRVKMVSEVLTSIKLIKLYAWESSFSNIIHEHRRKEKKIIFIMDIVQGFTFSMAFVLISVAPVVVITIHKSNGNELTVSEVYTMIALYGLTAMYISLGPTGMRALAETFVALKRIKNLMNQKEQNKKLESCEDENHVIEVTNADFTWEKNKVSMKEQVNLTKPTEVTFAPENTNGTKVALKEGSDESCCIPTLVNINLTVKKKSLVGICGSVGAGKSSLVEALLNEMTLTSGGLRITDSIAYVSQQAWITNATIRENILFSKNYEEQFYKDVCKACALEDDFKIMPSGDLTEIGERGVNLSGGQKQRISLARAVYAQKELCLLDDPLSAVDSHVGKHIFENCIKLSLRHHTVLFVTHQLQYLKGCDYVIYMEDGKFAEEGTYDELINNNQTFAEMIQHFHKDHAKSEEPATFEEKLQLLEVTKARSESLVLSEDLEVEEVIIENCEDKRLMEQGKLITEEDKVKGAVSFSTYLHFCQFAGGIVPTLLVFVSVACAVASQLTAEYCLALWLNYQKVIKQQVTSNRMHMINMTNDTVLLNAIEKSEFFSTLYWSIALLTAAFSIASVFFTVYFILKASTRLHNIVLNKILCAPLSFFETTPIGRILNRFTKDIDTIDNVLPYTVGVCLQILFRAFGPIIFICIAVPYYIVMVIFELALMYLMNFIYRKVVRSIKRIENVTRSPIYSHITATVQGLSSIRAYQQQAQFSNRFREFLDENINASYLYASATRWFALYCDFICILGVVVISVVALLLKDSIAPSILGLCVLYTIKMTDILQYGIRQIAETESNFTSVERLNEYRKSLKSEGKYQTDDKELSINWPTNGIVEFEKVSFRYRDNMPLALKDLSFCINDKEKIGIVGRTGAGKSSLSVVLYRLANIEKGSIKISGVDIKEIGLYDLRNSLSMIPQDPVLFIGTIRYNLDPFSKSTDEELWNVLEKAHIKASISVLPDKLESMVAENGSNFSVGERQLICMARALLRKSKILILDEATAAIDANTDSKIQAMIKEAFCNCTVLTIAHRLNTIMHCDRILLMEKGEILEFDVPSILLQKDSHFSKMVEAANIKSE